MKNLLLSILLLSAGWLYSQETPVEVLSFEEYLAFVKHYHPVAKQAGLQIERGEAELLSARGGFDPRIEVDYNRKEFRGTEYYDILNSTFKIPTWYGIELKANFEQNQGEYLNPENIVPQEGLFSAGVSIDLGQGLIINQRMADLRTARALIGQTIAERDLVVNQVIYDASLAYFNWLRVYNEMEIYREFLVNASERFEGIKQSADLGEIPAIDTVEAKITVQSRSLQLEQARVGLMRERLNLSNFLWIENVPVELQPNMVPQRELLPERVDNALGIPTSIPLEFSFENHPRLRSLEYQLEGLEINRRLMANRLLPYVNFQYNFLTTQPDELQTFIPSNYKAGLRVRVPLFMRRERGQLQLANFRLQDATLELQLSERQIENRIIAVFQELDSYRLQNTLAAEMAENYRILLEGEERMMSFGESSIFLLITREMRLIEARLTQNNIFINYLSTKARLFQSLGNAPQVD